MAILSGLLQWTPGEERHATLAPGPGVEYGDGYRQNALADVRTATTSVSWSCVLVLWLTVIFISFGLYAPFTPTVVSKFVRLRAVGFRLDPFDAWIDL